MKADKWLELNLVSLVVLGGLVFLATRVMDLDRGLGALDAKLSFTSGRIDQIARTVPDVAATDQKTFEAWLNLASERNAQTYAVSGAGAIDEAMFVPIGGIDQWITIRGDNRANPVLLFLHGGPGDVTNPWSYGYFRPWEKDFTVVQWDQRGAGRTLGRSGESVAGTMTVDRMVQDGIDLSNYLRQHLHASKLILVGHSWGSVLGVLMAKARPDLFYAFVGTGQIVDEPAADRIAYQLAIKTAKSAGDSQAVAELTAAGPPPYADGSKGGSLLSQWQRVCEGPDAERFLAGELGLALTAPGYSMRDINDWHDGQALGGRRLQPQVMSLDAQRLTGDFSVPVFVFQGADDCTTPSELAKRYVASIKAPSKAFVAVPNAGHFAVFMQSDEFLGQLTLMVRPLALRAH